MGVFANVGRAAFVWLSLLGQPAFAGTFVYVSNAEDGDVGVYAMGPDGELKAGARAGSNAGDADGGEPGPALPLCGRALEAAFGDPVRY